MNSLVRIKADKRTILYDIGNVEEDISYFILIV